MPHPAAGGDAVQAGDHRHRQGPLGLGDVVQVGPGAGVVVGQVGEVRLGLAGVVGGRLQQPVQLQLVVGELLLEQRRQHHRPDPGRLQPHQPVQLPGQRRGRGDQRAAQLQTQVAGAKIHGHGALLRRPGLGERPRWAGGGRCGPPRRAARSSCQRSRVSSSARAISRSNSSGAVRASMAKRASVAANSRSGTVGALESRWNGRSASGVVAVQGPVAGADGVAHVGHRPGHVEPVGDAGRVGDDQRRARPGLGLQQGLDGLHVAGPDGHLGHIDVAVGHGQHAQVLLGGLLAAGGELGHRPPRGRLGRLAAGVGVDLGVQHQQVHVLAGGQHGVHPARADVIGPAVPADDPDAAPDQLAGQPLQLPGVPASPIPARRRRRSSTRSRWAATAASPCWSASRMAVARSSPTWGASRSRSWRARAACRSAASRMPRPNSALSSNSELAQAGPRPSALTVQGVVGRLPP